MSTLELSSNNFSGNWSHPLLGIFRLFCLSLTSFLTQKFSCFVDCFCLFSDRLAFARPFRSRIWMQASVPSECFLDALYIFPAQKLIVAELTMNLIADILQGSFSKCSFPLLRIRSVFFHILVKQPGRWIKHLAFLKKKCANIHTSVCSPSRPVQGYHIYSNKRRPWISASHEKEELISTALE